MLYTRIPLERVGVLIGPEGRTKALVEERTGVVLLVDSRSGEVTLDERAAADPSDALKVQNLVRAIGRGFSEGRALRLLEDDVYFEVLDIKDFAGRGKQRIAQVKGRIIGTRGRTRTLIEELSGANMSVYGHTVALIGDPVQLAVARKAVEMLLRGSEHATVYRFLERKRAELKMHEKGL
jgi:ribosomal RNA assembly protein